MSADTIARLKMTLDDVEPTVLRRVDVPFDIRLDRLQLTIQAAMGWTNSHPRAARRRCRLEHLAVRRKAAFQPALSLR
jgi:Plasmid pRiA4b ORF-3-like protein